MPRKNQFQKSRLNSLDPEYISRKSLRKQNGINSTKASKSTIDTEENLADQDENKIEELELEKKLSKTSLLVLDYLQFKAARVIQRFARGWLCRRLYKRKRKAAIVIQAEWRRFYCQRLFFKKLEDLVQQQIEMHFNRSAQKIQALWRGWWVRKHIHDHTHMLRLQRTAGEDLLYCVAFKLHHLLRTHQIPGVYSLRNSNCLSKVEKLLASLTFKHCNKRTRQAKVKRQYEIDEAKKKHRNSEFLTEIPFSGPNLYNSCKAKCLPLYKEKDVDRKMAKILQMYEEANRETAKSRIFRKKSKPSKSLSKPSSTSFCDAIVNSMKKWKIISNDNLNLDTNVMQKPLNVQHFLTEVESKMSILQENCGTENKRDKQKL